MRPTRRNSRVDAHAVTINNNNLPPQSHREKAEASTSSNNNIHKTVKEPNKKFSKRRPTDPHQKRMSSKIGDEVPNIILHKTKTKAIKKRKDKKMKAKEVKAVADSLNLRHITNLRNSGDLSERPTIGKQKKKENSKPAKSVKQKPKSKNSETAKKGKTVAKRIVRNVQSAFQNKKNEPLKTKPKMTVHKIKKRSPKKTSKRRGKASKSSYVSAVSDKVCVVEGYNKEVSDNSWIDIDNFGNDCKDGSHSTLQVTSVRSGQLRFVLGGGLIDVDCPTSKVSVVDLAASNSQSKPSRKSMKSKKKAEVKLRSSGEGIGVTETANLPHPLEDSLKFSDGSHPMYLRTSTPKDLKESGFFSVGRDTSTVLNSGDVGSTTRHSTNKSSSRKRKIVDEGTPTSEKMPKNDKNDALSEMLNYKFYSLESSSECLVVLHFGSVLAFYGKALVKVVYGCANILGHHLTNLDRFTPVFSPESHSALSITTERAEVDIVDLANKLDAISLNRDGMKSDILDQMGGGNSCLLSIKRMEHGLTRYLTYFDEFKDVFNTKLPKTYLQTRNVEIAFSIGLQLVFLDKDFQTTFQPPPRYEEVCGTISMTSPDTPPVVVTCGKKNVGKSTFCRYLMNSLLRKWKQVLYLECDIGQTEFTPPGIVSLTEVCEPVLGPPFCHHQQPKRMCYFGDVNVRDYPDRYIACIKHVLDYYQHSCADSPLVINTMGWTQDMGLMLLIDIIRMTNPTHIVQFIPPVQSVPPPLETEYIASAEGWSVKETDLGLAAQLVQVNVNGEQSTNQRYKASDMRTLALLTTLFDLQPNPLPEDPVPLAGMVPMVVPWKDVAVCIPHYHVPRAQVLYVLNASIVGLCAFDTQQVAITTEDGKDESLNVLSSSPVCDCFGIGVIRGIDPVNKVFYIITSVAEQHLHAVNLLMGGTIPVPKQLLEQGQDGDVPYTKHHSTFRETGSAPLRQRKNLKRFNLRRKNKLGRK